MKPTQWKDAKKELPVVSGHYLVIWDTSCSREYPSICSEYRVTFWSCGQWCAPVSEASPILAWAELPEYPDFLCKSSREKKP